MSLTKWEKRFIELSQLVGSWSKDPSTKCGCVIARGNRVVSIGFNGYPSGILDTMTDARQVRLDKIIHAEVNAILYARQNLEGAELYVTPFQPCARCATLIVQSGIGKVITATHNGNDIARWADSFFRAEQMFREADIDFRKVILK